MQKDVDSLFQEAKPETLHSIYEWIKGVLSHPQSSLNNLAPCPFAKEALVKKEIQIFSTDTQVKDSIFYLLKNFDSYQKRVLILTCPSQNMTAGETTDLVNSIREKFSGQDIWLMYDHPEIAEKVLDVDFSYGKETLFFIQKLSDLSQSSQQLMDKGYYKNWSQDYFDCVFSNRETAFKSLQKS